MTADEMIDVLSEDGEVINTISRKKAEQNNHITQNVLIFIFNSHGNVWVQLRPSAKRHYPGKWDISACGAVVSGETHERAAAREATEETGLQLELHYIESFLNVFPVDTGEERKRLSHLYVAISDEIPEVSDEVDEFMCWQPNILRADILKTPNRYVPSFITELDKAIEGLRELVSSVNMK